MISLKNRAIALALTLACAAFWAPPASAQALDSDKDGIPDLVDLDDDNDGIPDASECATTTTSLIGLTILRAANTPAPLNNTDTTYHFIVGDRLLKTNALSYAGQQYDAVIEFTAIDLGTTGYAALTNNGLGELAVKRINTTQAPYIAYNLLFVPTGTATPTGALTPANLKGIRLQLADIDGNNNANMTDVMGYSNAVTPSLVSYGAEITPAGWAAGSPARPTTYTYYRALDYNGTTSTGGTNTVANTSTVQDPLYSVYVGYDAFTQKSIIYGVTGSITSVGERKQELHVTSNYACAFTADGLPPSIDLDTDNDGIPDLVEAGGVDTNGDGRVDATTDTDGDGLANQYDTDNGGFSLTGTLDTDGDGITNINDLDSDNDGLPDVLEIGGTDANNDGKLDGFVDADGDGFNDVVDTDDDGTAGVEDPLTEALLRTGTDTNADGRPDSFPVANADGNGLPNPYDLDSDGDGITDTQEAGVPDADKNGIADGAPTGGSDANGWTNTVDGTAGGTRPTIPNTDGNGKYNYLDIDSDNDGIPDIIEAQTTAGYLAPLGTDGDNDGIDDSYDNNDAVFGGAANNGLQPVNTDGAFAVNDAIPDYLDSDSDNDNQSDRLEAWDTNGNEVIDGAEKAFVGTTDSDGDGLMNEYDIINGLTTANNVTNNTNPNSYPNADVNATTERDWREVESFTLSGTVFKDQNGLNDSDVNGTASTLSGLNLVLVNSLGNVAAVATASSTDGTFSFTGLFTGNYTIRLTTLSATVGSPAPAIVLPSGYVSSGQDCCDNTGNDGSPADAQLSVSLVNAGLFNANFGINALPVVYQYNGYGFTNPGGSALVNVPSAAFDGDDDEDGSYGNLNTRSVRLTPPVDGSKLYYDYDGAGGAAPVEITAATTIPNFNNDNVYVDPAATAPNTTVSFTYQVIDDAGYQSAPQSITMGFGTTILPATGLQLQGRLTNGQAILNWLTLTQTGTSHFIVQRSFDGQTFNDITRVNAAGNSQQQLSYSFTDVLRTNARLAYYRIVLVDADGRKMLSNTLAISMLSTSKMAQVLPNPVTTGFNVVLSTAGSYQIKLSNSLGATIATMQVANASNGQVASFGRNGLASGIYYLQVTNNATGKSQVSKLVFE